MVNMALNELDQQTAIEEQRRQREAAEKLKTLPDKEANSPPQPPGGSADLGEDPREPLAQRRGW
jgi:hypothetical protein